MLPSPPPEKQTVHVLLHAQLLTPAPSMPHLLRSVGCKQSAATQQGANTRRPRGTRSVDAHTRLLGDIVRSLFVLRMRIILFRSFEVHVRDLKPQFKIPFVNRKFMESLHHHARRR